MPAEWIFDRLPPSKSREGGIAANQVFRANIDTFVREVIQNSLDQAIENEDGSKKQVDVSFKLEKSTGPNMQALLDAVGWESLSEHLDDSERHGGETISGRLREGLELIELGSIRALTVEDRNTNGLTGSEDGDSNFANLCRNQLITSSERKESGGSFGIGKSVLWLFSTLSTVLFASRPVDREGLRFIGRTYLPSHKAFEKEWKGPGWFGTPDEDDGQPWAVSMSGEPGDEVASRCGIYREPGEFGTSILVLGFDDPSLEDEPSVADTCQLIQDSASRWYWPALERGDLTVEVAGTEDGEIVFTGASSSDFVEVSPFVSAMVDPVSESGVLEEPGDVIEKHISVKIPVRTDGKAGVVDAKARLRLRADAPDDDQTHGLEVALQRGTGMVVENYQPRIKQRPALDLRGVLLAGKASGLTPEDHALEKFLRASEPPAHNCWDHTTQRLKSDYKTSGRKRAIESVYQQIDDAIAALVDEIVVDTDAVPDFLRRMLPLGGSGARKPTQRSRLKGSSGYLVDSSWQFEGTFENSQPPPEGWSFDVRIDVDQEGSGKKTVIPIAEFDAPGCEVKNHGGDKIAVNVMPGISLVTFSGTTGKVPVHDPRRVKMKLLATLAASTSVEQDDE